jgi:hypothetical protein
MSAETAGGGEQAARRYQQFLQLLPATLAVAGLPPCEKGHIYSDDQLDVRIQALRRAYKHVKAFAREQAAAAE